MSNYVQFPTFGGGPAPQAGPYVHPTGQTASGHGGPGIPAGYAPAYYPQPGAQSNATASALQGPTQEGVQAFMNVRLPDGSASYVPVISQMVGGRLQWVAGPQQPSAGTSPSSGGGMPLAGGQQAYSSEQYRAAAERDPGNAKYYRKQEKEALKVEKQSAKKAREWEKAQRAREEEEARQRGPDYSRQEERARRLSTSGYERDRRPSVPGQQPSGILHRAPSGTDLDRRFGTMNMNGAYPASLAATTGAPTRSRRLSVAEPSSETAFQRARRVSMSNGGYVPGDGNTGERSRKVSYNNGSATPASAVGAFYPDRDRALGAREQYDVSTSRSPGYAMPGTLPHGSYIAPDVTGRGHGHGGQMVPHGAAYGVASPYAGHQAMQPMQTGGGSSIAPAGFYREPSRSVAYTRFDTFCILWDLNELRKFGPPLPALLVPSDITHDDWNRCMADIAAAWTGVLPYDLFARNNNSRHKRTMSSSTPSSMARALTRPSSAVAQTLDIWNAAFFYARKVEMVLYRGLERRSGVAAGKRSERLRLDSVPSQYLNAILGPKTRRSRHASSESDDDESDVSSLTESSTSADSSDSDSASDDEEGSEGEPAYVTKARERERQTVGMSQFPQTPFPASRSRRNSVAAPGTLMSAGGAGMDMHEMWAVKSREAAKLIRSRQKLERKRRKLERRQRRRQLKGEPLYSLWVACLR